MSKFIVFEGLDGSGKGTQIRLLCEEFKRRGEAFQQTAEPTFSVTGGAIRDALNGNHPRHPAELAALFLTDRIYHNTGKFDGIELLLSQGKHVICDRYYYSSFAYQGTGCDMQWVMEMNLNCPNIRRPDLCIYLDVDPQRSKARVDGANKSLEIFEQDVAQITAIRNKFMKAFELLGDRETVVLIDADRPVDVVAADVWDAVRRIL